MNNYLKSLAFLILLLFVFIYADYNLFIDIPKRLEGRPSLYQTVFYVNYIGLLIGSLILFTVNSRAIRIGFSLFFFLTLSVALAMNFAHGNTFTKLEANIIFTEFQFAGEAISAFFYPYAKAIALAFLITVLLFYIGYKYLPRIENVYALVPLVFVAYSVKLNYSSKAWHTLFPAVYNIPIVAADAYFSIPRFGPRESVNLEPVHKGMYQHIIWIIDESVRADMLSINGAALPTTPFLDSIRNQYLNYGIMSASSQYSFGSNMVLQSGLRLNQLPDTQLHYGTNPNIFQYSKKAGYTTYYIDGQSRTTMPSNGMTHYDFNFIDYPIKIHKEHPGIKWPSVDSTIVHYLKKILASKQNTFTYINKAGCHFAYNHFYPENRTLFRPSYKDGDAWKDSAVLRNTYANCINWNVDEFFRKLYPETKHKNAIVLYTSDHGVSLLEKGRPVQDTGPVDPLPVRASVPFLVFTDSSHSDLFQFAENNKNKLTHFSLFPSTLFLLGYDELAIKKQYGEMFFTKWKKQKRQFFSGTIYDPEQFYLNTFE